MNRLTLYYLRTSLLLAILATAFNSIQAGPSYEVVQVLTDSIPKPLPRKSLGDIPPPPPPPPTDCAEPFRIVEQMPQFPGCEHLTDKQERKTCADRKLIEYLHANLKLTPLQVQSCGVVGTVIIQFVVKADGTVAGARIMRDIGAGYGQAALKVVESMTENGIHWIPGRQRGRAVPVQFNVPVRINLE